ncbi:hypothetical protein DKP78_26045, partial [Enterococcus faecium]
DGGAEDEAAALGADDEVDVLAAEGVGEQFHGEGDAGGVGQERRDVAEEDPLLGEVVDVADEALEALDHAPQCNGARG